MSKTITLKAARVNAGLTIRQAASMFGVHHQTLSQYEKNSENVPYSFIKKIPEIYKLDKDDIFFGDMYEYIRTLNHEEQIKK